MRRAPCFASWPRNSDTAVTNRCLIFCRLVLDFRYGGAGEVVRHFFTVTLTDQEIGRITLGEGQAVGVFSGEDVMAMAKVVPYTTPWPFGSTSTGVSSAGPSPAA